MKAPKVTKSINYSNITLDFYNNNAIMYKLNDKAVDWFHSIAKTKEKTIDTRNAKRTSIKSKVVDDTCYISATYKQDDLVLVQNIEIEKDKPYFKIYVTLDDNGNTTSNYLVPLDFAYPNFDCNELFLSLEARMICVPYDNDMWVHYESTYLRPGRTSYDVTAIYNDHNFNGLVLGAINFDTWKNAITCSAWDARCFSAISGVADASTHDHLPHGYINDTTVDSATFVCGYYDDIRDGLQVYGTIVSKPHQIYHWDNGVPFGWNSYSALTLNTTLNHIKKTADFIYEELPNFKSEDGVTYINFDAVIGIDNNAIKRTIKKLHARNQKVGWYMAPLCHMPILDHMPLKGTKHKFKRDILLKNADGSNYPTIDGKYPVDITIPEAELDFRLSLREFVDMGFDYLKIDFLSHGAVEGVRYNKELKTGRQAYNYFWNIIHEELDPNKIGRTVFISSSIDPLFPCGQSHSRRCSCDAFGRFDDVKYILNALNYAWWTNNTLYQFNDPDHTVLYKSMVDGRAASNENEARSRYNASLISGTVMLLSDNYGPKGDKEVIENSKARALKLANNEELNKIARMNKAFRPLYLSDTSNVYYYDNYLAVFNFEDKTMDFDINPTNIKFKKSGELINLNNNKKITYKNTISISLKAYDSVILKLI